MEAFNDNLINEIKELRKQLNEVLYDTKKILSNNDELQVEIKEVKTEIIEAREDLDRCIYLNEYLEDKVNNIHEILHQNTLEDRNIP